MFEEFISSFSLESALNLVVPLGLFVLGIIMYSVLVFKAYLFISKRDIFEGYKDYKKYKESFKQDGWFSSLTLFLLHIFEYVFLFPFLVFFFFVFFFIVLVFMAKNSDVSQVLMLAMSIIGAIRVTSYISEDLSKDIAKLLPFALLGIFIVDMSYFSTVDQLNAVFDILNYSTLNMLVYYLLFIVILEFTVRVIHKVISSFYPDPYEE